MVIAAVAIDEDEDEDAYDEDEAGECTLTEDIYLQLSYCHYFTSVTERGSLASKVNSKQCN